MAVSGDMNIDTDAFGMAIAQLSQAVADLRACKLNPSMADAASCVDGRSLSGALNDMGRALDERLNGCGQGWMNWIDLAKEAAETFGCTDEQIGENLGGTEHGGTPGPWPVPGGAPGPWPVPDDRAHPPVGSTPIPMPTGPTLPSGDPGSTSGSGDGVRAFANGRLDPPATAG